MCAYNIRRLGATNTTAGRFRTTLSSRSRAGACRPLPHEPVPTASSPERATRTLSGSTTFSYVDQNSTAPLVRRTRWTAPREFGGSQAIPSAHRARGQPLASRVRGYAVISTARSEIHGLGTALNASLRTFSSTHAARSVSGDVDPASCAPDPQFHNATRARAEARAATTPPSSMGNRTNHAVAGAQYTTAS